MNEFISVQLILSLAGCVTLVITSTQLLKRFISIDPKKIALVMSVIVAIARIIALGKYNAISILIGVLNIIPILWGSMSGYDIVLKNKNTPAEDNKQEEDINLDNKNINVVDSNEDKSNTVIK